MAGTLIFNMEAQEGMAKESEFVNMKEAAQILGCSIASVKKGVESGAIPAVKVSERVYRIPRAALEPKINAGMQLKRAIDEVYGK